MSKNTVILTLGSIILVFGFLFAAYFATNKTTSQPELNPAVAERVNKLDPADHAKWSPKKKILLIEYGDYQCPACQAWNMYFTQLERSNDPDDKKIQSEVTFIYRHFPLIAIHPYAQEAAYVAEAAGKQGKFFEMTDFLYENQNEWVAERDPTIIFEDYAKDLKLNMEKFSADIKADEVKKFVEDQRLGGLEASIQSTPTFFLNGQLVQVEDFEDFRKLLLETVNEK